METIWVHRAGVYGGPYTFEELRSLADAGHVSSRDLAWQPGMQRWQTVAAVLALGPNWTPYEPTRGALVMRVLLALSADVAVTLLALISARRDIRNYDSGQHWTRQTLQQVECAVQSYVQEKGSPPLSLKELGALKDMAVNFSPDGDPLDGWDRPFAYVVNGKAHVAASLGRDGKSGGRGLDADLSNVRPDPPDSSPTWHQFLFEMPTGRTVAICFGAGALALVGGVTLVRPRPVSARGLAALLLRGVLVAIAALIVGGIVQMVQVGGGH